MMLYEIPEGNSIVRIQFNRKLFEYNMQTNGGRGKTKTKGILSQYEKPAKCCVIFKETYLDKIKKLCKESGVKSHFYRVTELE